MKHVLHGLCVSPGNAEGFVVICRDIDTTSIPDTDKVILVLPYLDRNLIVKLKQNVVGIIAENGSIGSHGAGILREMKIPCIVRVSNALDVLHPYDNIRIIGSKGIVEYSFDRSLPLHSSVNLLHSTYEQLNKDRSDIIRLSKTIDCYRPNRKYQKLRFEMLKPAWERSPDYLFGLPCCDLLQNESGIVFVKNGPRILDICSYYMRYPQKLILVSRERSSLFNKIKEKLTTHLEVINGNVLGDIASVLLSAVQSYQQIMLYVYSSQYIYDNLIEILLDIVSTYDAEFCQSVINQLKSDYVINSVKSAENPGISQIWSLPSREPFIWKGSISYEPLRIEKFKESALKEISKNTVVYQDFDSLLQVVPIVYQMAEEFYYTSSSIHSFINRGLEIFSKQAQQRGILDDAPENIYNWPLDYFTSFINSFL